MSTSKDSLYFDKIADEKAAELVKDVHSVMTKHFPDSVVNGCAGIGCAFRSILEIYIQRGVFSEDILDVFADTIADRSIKTLKEKQK
jgi:hypothetical protein